MKKAKKSDRPKREDEAPAATSSDQNTASSASPAPQLAIDTQLDNARRLGHTLGETEVRPEVLPGSSAEAEEGEEQGFNEQRAEFRRALGIGEEHVKADKIAFPATFFDSLVREKPMEDYKITRKKGETRTVKVTGPVKDSLKVSIDKIMPQLPARYRRDPDVQRLLQSSPTADFQKVKEVLAARQYAQQVGIDPATIQSVNQNIDFKGKHKGTDTEEYFDPFGSPAEPQMTQKTKAENVLEHNDEAAGRGVDDRQRAGLRKKWLDQTYPRHTDDTKGEEHNVPVTGVWDQTFSTPEQIQDLQQDIKKPGNVAYVDMKLDDAFVREHIAAERQLRRKGLLQKSKLFSSEEPDVSPLSESEVRVLRPLNERVNRFPAAPPDPNVLLRQLMAEQANQGRRYDQGREEQHRRLHERLRKKVQKKK